MTSNGTIPTPAELADATAIYKAEPTDEAMMHVTLYDNGITQVEYFVPTGQVSIGVRLGGSEVDGPKFGTDVMCNEHMDVDTAYEVMIALTQATLFTRQHFAQKIIA